jgi:hypothetical protein
MAAARLADEGVLGTEPAPAGDPVVGGKGEPGGEVLFGLPAVHVGPDFGHQLQRGVRTDRIYLTEVDTTAKLLQGAADFETRLTVLRAGLAARWWERSRRRWLLSCEACEQRLDFCITLGHLLEQELIGGKVLLEREQLLGAIVAAATISACEAWQRWSRCAASRSGLRSSPRIARMILSPVWLISVSTESSLRFISVNALCMRLIRVVVSSTKVSRWRRKERSGTMAAAGRKLARNRPTLWSSRSHSQSLTSRLRPRTLCRSWALTSRTSKPRCSRIS